ncbi:hypothetical protein SLEP1_g9198 [Rubroshorea leprosula]|uniref:Transmembrane protein n=1 Tax=Rubroshorea leprosula TaxID=152421 RepID=A0AAV5IA36_9ROSI|nr:hypothetical protein SLEP1_g9198 [Rubroshorea leprosula]
MEYLPAAPPATVARMRKFQIAKTENFVRRPWPRIHLKKGSKVKLSLRLQPRVSSVWADNPFNFPFFPPFLFCLIALFSFRFLHSAFNSPCSRLVISDL